MPSQRHAETGPNAASIRILQFNTWLRNQQDQEVLSFVEAEQPDVASLQETTESLRAAVSSSMANRYRILSAGSELLLLRRDAQPIQMRDWSRHILPGGEAIEVQLVVKGRGMTLLSLHAMAPVGFAKAAIRDAQFEWVARWCRRTSEPRIILGDLNATPWSHSFSRLLRDGELIDSTQGFGVQPTWRTSYGPFGGVLAWPLRIPIDHCLHSPEFVAVAREIGPACGSNHYPLLVTLGFTKVTSP
jgi:endonuclease/exonuclease/phosphatase (EEP) superfamily protein YafD